MVRKIFMLDNGNHNLAPGKKNIISSVEADKADKLSEIPYYEMPLQDIGFSRPDTPYLRSEVTADRGVSKEPESGPTDVVISKEKSMKKYLYLVACASAVLLITVAALLFRKGEEAANQVFASKASLEVLINSEKNKTYVYNTEGQLLHLFEKATFPIWYSLDYSSVYLLSTDRSGFCYVGTEGSVQFLENIHAYDVTGDGKFLYSARNENGLSRLYLYTPETNSTRTIETSEDLAYPLVCISPDGNSYAYVKSSMEWENPFIESYLCINGDTPKSFGKDTIVLKVSDDGRYIYYAISNPDNGPTPFYVNVDGVTKLLSDDLTTNNIYFNQDYSEVMFAEKTGTYISVNGHDKIQISDSAANRVVLPYPIFDNGRMTTTYPIKSFREKAVIFEDRALRYIDASFETHLLASLREDYQCIVSQDYNETICCNSLDEIISYQDLKGARNKKVTVEVAKGCEVSKDLEQLYYTKRMNTDNSYDNNASATTQLNELYYLDKDDNRMPTFISSYVTSIIMNPANSTLFFVVLDTDGKYSLYYSKEGDDAIPVDGLQSCEAISLEAWNYSIAAKVNEGNGFRYYYNTTETQFKQILAAVSGL